MIYPQISTQNEIHMNHISKKDDMILNLLHALHHRYQTNFVVRETIRNHTSLKN